MEWSCLLHYPLHLSFAVLVPYRPVIVSFFLIGGLLVFFIANFVLYFNFVISSTFYPLGFFCLFCPFRSIYVFGELFQNQLFAYIAVLFLKYFIIGIKMVGELVVCDLLIRNVDDDVLCNSDDICLRIYSDISVEVATERVFIVGHI